jgi:hypothetical protein
MPAIHRGDVVLEDKTALCLHPSVVSLTSQEVCMLYWQELASKPELCESYHFVQTPLSLINQVLTHHFDANWSVTLLSVLRISSVLAH